MKIPENNTSIQPKPSGDNAITSESIDISFDILPEQEASGEITKYVM